MSKCSASDNNRNKLVLTKGEENANEKWDGEKGGGQPCLIMRG